MNIWGIDVSLDEVQQIVTKISGKIVEYINRDKNTICVVLEILNRQILEWYEDINEKFAPWVVNRTVEASEIIEIVKRARSDKRKSALENSQSLLNNFVERYDRRELGRLRNNLDIDKVRQIVVNLNDFAIKVKAEKEAWADTVQRGSNIDQTQIDRINEWQKVLSDLRTTINELVSSVQITIGCQQTSSIELLKRVKQESST